MSGNPTLEAFQFSYLPYFPTDNIDLRVGRLHLFNFWRHKDNYITDQRLRDKIEQMCALYFEIDFNPHNESGLMRLDKVTIAVIDDNYAFTPLTDEQLEALQRYTLALAVCSLVKNDRQAGNFSSCCVSEHFTTFHQNLDFTTTGMSYYSGSYIRTRQLAEVDHTKFVKPQFIPGAVLYRHDSELLEAFANMIDAHQQNDQYIFEVLTWIKNAFLNSDSYSYASRCVMMATAFEALFKLQDAKAREFSEGLEALLQADSLLLHDRAGLPVGTTTLPRTTKTDLSNNVRRYRDNTPINLTMYGWWAREFYALRSKIVHTGITEWADFVNHNDIQHVHISLHVMHASLFRWLEERGYLVYTKHADPQQNEIARFLDFSSIHRSIETMIR